MRFEELSRYLASRPLAHNDQEKGDSSARDGGGGFAHPFSPVTSGRPCRCLSAKASFIVAPNVASMIQSSTDAAGLGMGGPSPFEVTADRAFFFAIIDDEAGTTPYVHTGPGGPLCLRRKFWVAKNDL